MRASLRPQAGPRPGDPPACDRHRDERHARPVDEVGGRRCVEHDGVGARADPEMADVVAAQRAGFVATERYLHATNGALHDFVRMTRGPLPGQSPAA